MSTTDTKALTVRLPRDLAARIWLAAAKEQKSQAQWIREALQLVVERVEARDA